MKCGPHGSELPIYVLQHNQGYTNPERLVIRASKFFSVAPNECGHTLQNLYHVVFLASRIYQLFMEFGKFMHH